MNPEIKKLYNDSLPYVTPVPTGNQSSTNSSINDTNLSLASLQNLNPHLTGPNGERYNNAGDIITTPKAPTNNPVYSNNNVAPTSVVTQPAVMSPTPTPTSATAGTNVVVPTGSYVSPEEQAFQQQMGNYLSGLTNNPQTDEQVRQEALQRMQAEIDATNAMYADELARAKITGQGRLGTSTAIAGRRGLIGSDFGEAQIQGTENLNEQVYKSIENERLAKINSIMTQAQQYADQQIKDKRQAMLAGFDARTNYYKNQETRKSDAIQQAVTSLINQKLDPNSVDNLDAYAKYYGLSADDIKSQYNNYLQSNDDIDTKLKQAQIDKINNDINSGKLVKVKNANGNEILYNSATGEIINPSGDSSTAVDMDTYNKAKAQLQTIYDSLDNVDKYADYANQDIVSRTANNLAKGYNKRDQLENYLNTVKTNVLTAFSNGDIKKFFGPQMSDADVKQMMSAGTPLSINMSPKDIRKEVDKIRKKFEKAEQYGAALTIPNGQTSNTENQNLDSQYDAVFSAFDN